MSYSFSVLFFVSIFSFSQVWAKNRLIIGVYDFAPHVIAEGSENLSVVPKGAVIDMLKDVSSKSLKNYEIEFRVLPFARMLEELASGKIDMGVCLAKTPERMEKFRYLDEPFKMAAPAVILKKSEAPSEIKSLKQLSGKTLGHLKGSITPAYLEENGIQISYLSGEQYHLRNLEKLRIKRIDGIFVPTYSNGVYELIMNQQADQYSILKLPAPEFGLYFVFRKNISQKILDDFNSQSKVFQNQYLLSLKKYLKEK